MQKSSFLLFVIFSVFISLESCEKDAYVPLPTPELMEIPKGFPEMEFTEGNEYSFERWSLGKKLFYDKSLSRNYSVSCASCHKVEFAFADNQALSKGEQERLGTSNAPSLTNIGYHPYFTRAGAVPTLEMQVLIPIQEHNEFDFNIVELAERLSENSDYVQAARDCYDRELDPYVIVRALANFERSFISGNSPFDQYQYQGKTDALSKEALKGKELFFSGKTNCSSCHSGFNFTDYTFQNNGLHKTYRDTGKMRVTKLESDRALFKVPSLRNVEYSGPYMHDGSIFSLEQVVDHYNSGGENHPNKSELVKPLGLSKKEKEELVAFLKSLTDITFIQNPNFKNE